MNAIPLFAMDGIIRRAGARRISERASSKLAAHLEDRGRMIAHRAWLIARHSGRKEVNGDDIHLAARHLGLST